MYRSSRDTLQLLPRWPLAAVGLLALIAAFLISPPPPRPALLEASSAPAAPTGLAAAPGDQSVTLSWDNPNDSSITGYEYNVNHNDTSTGNFTGWSPWTTISNSGKDTTGHTFTGLTNGREYRYHLRAVNDTGPSVGAPANGPPWFASATPTSPDPDPPTNLRVERVCDHKLKVRWHRSAGATGYDLEIGSANGKHWKRLLTNWPGNSWYATNWQKDRTYRFAVRAVNEGGTSEWVNSALSVAPPCAVDNLRAVTSTTLGQTGGSITASWDVGKRANAYHVEYGGNRIVSNHAGTSHAGTVASKGSHVVSIQSVNGNLSSQWSNITVDDWLTVSDVEATSASLNLTGHSGQWWYQADTGPDSDCQGPVAAGTSTADLTGLTVHQQYTYQAYGASGCNISDLLASITFEPSGDELEASSITATGATLTLSNHTGNWWFKETSPDTGTCTAGDADFTNELRDLIPGTEYTYKAYDVDTCEATHEGASVTFTTGGVSVSNLPHAGASESCFVGYFNGVKKCATAFTTGDAVKAPKGYTLHSVTFRSVGKNGSPNDFTIALHATNGNYPASSPVSGATLSGSDPGTAGDYTYTCSGAGCQLSADTTYYVVMSTSDTSGSNFYVWRMKLSSSETLTPSDNKWSIADNGLEGPTLTKSTHVGVFKVSATVNP